MAKKRRKRFRYWRTVIAVMKARSWALLEHTYDDLPSVTTVSRVFVHPNSFHALRQRGLIHKTGNNGSRITWRLTEEGKRLAA